MPAGQEVLVRSSCKAWSCEYCAPKKAELYRRQILRAAVKHRFHVFVTLTLQPSKVHGDPVVYLNHVFALWRSRVHRRFGRLIYIRVLEFQRNGTPHFHLLIPQYIEKPWLQKSWSEVGGGWCVDVKLVDMRSAAAYISKALAGKMFTDVRPGFRRVTTSVGMNLLAKVMNEWTWTRFSTDIWTVVRWRVAVGATVRGRCDEDGELERAVVVFKKPSRAQGRFARSDTGTVPLLG